MPVAEKEKGASSVSLKCGCGMNIRVPVEAFGKTVRCPTCSGLLRLALAERKAPIKTAGNLLAKCATCGQINLVDTDMAGRETACFACGDKVRAPDLILPPPPKRVVKKKPKLVKKKPKRQQPEVSKTLAKAAIGGKVSLRPGQRICTGCGAVLEVGANICLECETNIVTNKKFESPGPTEDPVGIWRGPNKW
ncbi:MAG TPA: hypothetical protein PL033_13810 [Candidatus Brocadiia bacterium]|nr:hypothetical protein [Candidatus Brocadiia bacterium]